MLLFSFEDYALDCGRRELVRAGKPIAIEPQVFNLLEHLIRNRDRVVSRDDLIASVWKGRIVSESALNTRINAARRAIGDSGAEQRLIKTFSRKGVRFVGEVRIEGETPAVAAEAPHRELPDRPSIAVLPFANMSGDVEQEYFADGICEDIITALSKWRWFFVIARNSTFAYKGRHVDVRRIAQELGVRYVLEGSVRKAGNRIRVTAQLIDATNGAHIWAERYDRDLTDMFAIQDDVTQQVAAAIEPALANVEIERARHKTPEQMVARDHHMRGMWHFHQFSEEESDKALACFNRAIELDDALSEAYAGMARVMLSRTMYRFPSELGENFERICGVARRALALDPTNASACYVLSLASAHNGDADTALVFARRAIALNPNFALGHFALAVASSFVGRPDDALAAIDFALRLSPADPQRFAWLAQRASALYLLKRYAEASEAARQSLGLRWYHTACRVLAASCAQLDLIEPARSAIRELLSNGQADKTIEDVIRHFKRREDQDHYTEGLRKAGMPER